MGVPIVIRPLGESVRARRDHVRIFDEFTGESQEAQINPTSISEQIAASYEEAHPLNSAPGILVYGHTSNAEIPLHLVLDQELFPKSDILDFYRFIKSLLYPIRLGEMLGAPPDVLLVWPNLFSVQVKVTQLRTTWDSFKHTLKPLSYAMDIAVKETGQRLITSGDVRERIDVVQPESGWASTLPGKGGWY